jgi:acyl-CoA thioesterase I
MLAVSTQAPATELSASQNPRVAAEPPTILVVGDSLSSEYGIRRQSGWVELMRQRLAGTYPEPPRVINASISGDTTSGGLTRLPALLKQQQPGIVVIELGGNDALRGLSLQMTRDNLIRMVEMAQESGARVILTGIQIPSNYGVTYTEAFRDLYPQVSNRTGAKLVPFLLAGLETDLSLFIEDGIHPSEAAQPQLLENVWPAVTQAIQSKRSQP